MFGIRREQGRLAELAPVVRLLAAGDGRAGRGGRASPRCSPSWAWRPRRAASSRASPPTGSTRSAPRCGSASLTLPHRRVRGARRRGDRPRWSTRSSRPHAGANVMIGHVVACYGAADRYLGMLAATLGEWERAETHFERAMALNRRMGARDLARPHRLRVRAACCSPAAGGAASAQRAARRGGGARRARSGCRRCSPASARSRPAPRPAVPRRPVVARGADPRPRRAGPQQPRDRRRAVHQRAHRRQPHPQHPAQDALREPHRGRLLRPPARPGRGVSATGYDRPPCRCS